MAAHSSFKSDTTRKLGDLAVKALDQ